MNTRCIVSLRTYLLILSMTCGGAAHGLGDPLPAKTNHWGQSAGAAAIPPEDIHQNDSGSAYRYRASTLEYTLGSEIPRPAAVNLSLLPANGPEVEPAGAAFWHILERKLYAAKPGAVVIRWKQGNDPSINVQVLHVWSADDSDYQTHVLGTPAVDLKEAGVYDHIQLLAEDSGVDPTDVNISGRFQPRRTGRSLLLLSSGHPNQNPIFFQDVKTVVWSANLIANIPATVGDEITAIPGHQPICGAAHVFWPNSPYCPGTNFYDRARRTGPIIPVNTDKAGVSNDLVLIAYQQGAKLKNAAGTTMSSPICWPWQTLRYNVTWPNDTTNKIIIASQNGSGAIDEERFKAWDIYVQNDSAAPGFNPNDEHALRLPHSAGEALFALRDDLGTPTTSEPYVLMTYLDAKNDDRGQIKVFKVIAEEAPYFFNYTGMAGHLIQPPFPLVALQPCDASYGVAGPYWPDRNQNYWAKSAGDDGGTAHIVMRYHYPVQPGFFFPNDVTHPVGACVPWLDQGAGTPGTPIDIGYTISWPTTPELRVAETLVEPKNGLPDISLQTSVEIVYEQAYELGQGHSVKLIDPTRERQVDLAQLPDDIETIWDAGLLYFPTLPPSLRNRLRYDPINQRLKFHGQLMDSNSAESYLLLNVITEREKQVMLGLSADAGFQTAVHFLAQQASQAIEVAPDATDFDSLALTAGNADAPGYVTLAFGNNPDLSSPAEPVVLEVIRVTCPIDRGALKVIESENPFDEQLTLRYSGDFAGETEMYQFDWRAEPPWEGLPPTTAPEEWSIWVPTPPNGVGAVDITIAGPGLFTLSDNYFVCRYRRVTQAGAPIPGICGGGWSEWTRPQLAEGWIKRVLRGIHPFEQRMASYRDSKANAIVSMISQAGPRSVGNTPLDQTTANEFGLIEIYEKLLRRIRALSIDGTPALRYAPVNYLLLWAAGRLADLYMLLGNEAFADGSDPTIAFGATHGVYGAEAPSIHCFMNQTASLLEEELALFRGRDDTLLPGVQTYPFYNRLIWNFTRDFNGGEVAYALNYNIRYIDGDVKGTIDEADARILYPQGHGDAWGHYLTAIKNYYRLLQHPNFTWMPRTESVLVDGVPVAVDYFDERTFARVAAARARTGSEIVQLTYRGNYVEDPRGQYQGYPDTDPNRAWGVAEWGSRAGQGAFLDWVVANALLPAVDDHPSHAGIQIVDRTTVLELRDILSAFVDIQQQVDAADGGLNPLGLSKNVIPFDIEPAFAAAGKTHYEQIHNRAVTALNNAVSVFNYAKNSSQEIRLQADELTDFQQAVADREADFKSRLIEVFGYPYADDIGPTGAYDIGYDGPDVYHYDYIDPLELSGVPARTTQVIQVSMEELIVDGNGALQRMPHLVNFHLAQRGFGLIKPSSWTGRRRAHGALQMARSEHFQTLIHFEHALRKYDHLLARIQQGADLLKVHYAVDGAIIFIRKSAGENVISLNQRVAAARNAQDRYRGVLQGSEMVANTAAECLATGAGSSSDITSLIRRGIKMAAGINGLTNQRDLKYGHTDKQEAVIAKEEIQCLDEIELTALRQGLAFEQQLKQLEQLVREEAGLRAELLTLKEALQQISGRYLAALARGQRLLEDRLRFRGQTAGRIQVYRYKDMAFRIFRNDALQKYRAQFDLAARYVFMAAKTYDFETNLRPGDPRGPGEDFMTEIVRARALGVIRNGLPQTANGRGDAGLADPMARMSQNWDLVLKVQLGFNHPETETGRFSLRSELFRIGSGSEGRAAWRETLARHVVPNLLDLPAFQRYCIPFQPRQPVEPGIVIPFATTVNFGLNYFGWPLGGDDNNYDSSHFATKIAGVGVWFANYDNLGGDMINSPRVYLIPVGNDILRSPTSQSGEIREWKILDQAFPSPFPLSLGALGSADWIPAHDTLIGHMGDLRRHGRFRAYHDQGGFDEAEMIQDSLFHVRKSRVKSITEGSGWGQSHVLEK